MMSIVGLKQKDLGKEIAFEIGTEEQREEPMNLRTWNLQLSV